MDGGETLMMLLERLKVNDYTIPVFQFNKVIDDISEMFEKGTLFDFAKDFNSLKTDCDKVEYVSNLPFIKNLEFEYSFVEKSAELASLCRERGNASYLTQKYDDALSRYNLALLVAPYPSDQVKSDAMSLCYSNRSALLFRNGRYADALLDIDRAFKYGLPEHLHVKLWRRKGECFDAIGNYIEAMKCYISAKIIVKDSSVEKELQDLISVAKQANLKKKKSSKVDMSKSIRALAKPKPSVYGGINKQIPSASNSLAIVDDKQGGRRVIAAKDIPPGEPLIVEDAFSYTLAAQNFYQNCYYCLKRTDIPVSCRQCVTIFYCGEECRDSSWELNHKVECRILHLIHTSQKKNIQLQSTLLTSLKFIINIGPTQLKELFDEKNGTKKTNAHKPGFSKSGQYDSKSCLPILEMEIVEGKYWSLKEFEATIHAVVLLIMLDDLNFFDDTECPSATGPKLHVFSELSRFHIFVGSLILKQVCSLPFRGRYIAESHFLSKPDVPAEFTMQRIGYGAYSLFGLLKHSCDANTFAVFHGSAAIVYSMATISKGDALTENNMNCDYRQLDLDKRREIHQRWIRFDCKCPVCENNWPGKPLPSILSKTYTRFKDERMSEKVFSSEFFGPDQLKWFLEVMFLTNVAFEDKLTKKTFLTVLKLLRFFEQHLLKPCDEIEQVEGALKACLALHGYTYRDEKPGFVERIEEGHTVRVLTNVLCGSIVTK